MLADLKDDTLPTSNSIEVTMEGLYCDQKVLDAARRLADQLRDWKISHYPCGQSVANESAVAKSFSQLTSGRQVAAFVSEDLDEPRQIGVDVVMTSVTEYV
jgi:hypothetical protein